MPFFAGTAASSRSVKQEYAAWRNPWDLYLLKQTFVKKDLRKENLVRICLYIHADVF